MTSMVQSRGSPVKYRVSDEAVDEAFEARDVNEMTLCRRAPNGGVGRYGKPKLGVTGLTAVIAGEPSLIGFGEILWRRPEEEEEGR